jgi:eukaryotic-like serine/threonine-protein kinase
MIGRTLGHYQITEKLGGGGMGVVYKAEDTNLHRQVAIKVLPDEFAHDAERLARFRREAQVLASLNHPNIAAIHGLEESAGKRFIVMELADGETLATRISRGPLPVDEALAVCRQIAEGLEAAHERGVIHRDLKPANVMISADDRVKVLDFGLAKVLAAESQAADATRSPTITEAMTRAGTILGTAAYMSPEQAKGKAVDNRVDIWAFGCILFECVAGKRAFHGETTTEVLASILTTDPDWGALPAEVPPSIRTLLRRSLQKDPDLRLHDIADARIEIGEVKVAPIELTAVSSCAHVSWRWMFLAALAAVVLSAALFVLGQRWERGQNSPPVFRQLTFRRGTIQSARFAPDGNTIVYGAYWDGRLAQLFSVRPESPESSALPLPGADILSISSAGEMALSLDPHPDLQIPWGTLARASLAGGAPRELLERVQDAVWNPDGSALAMVRAELPGGGSRLEYPAGKVLYQITEGWLSNPRFSPDGEAIAFVEHPVKADDVGHVSLVDLRGKKRDLTGDYAGGLMGVAWTPAGDEVWHTAAESKGNYELRAVSRRGGPSRVVLRVPASIVLQDVFRDGRVLLTQDTIRLSMMIRTADSDRERDLAWLDFSNARDLSPDGTRVLFTEGGAGAGQRERAYLRKTDGSPAVRLGDGYAFGISPDGRWALSIVSHPSPQLFLLPTGAGEPQVLPRGKIIRYGGFSGDWFADSRRFVFAAREQGKERRLYIQDIQGGEPRAISREGLNLRWGRLLSPDQKYVAAIDTNDGKIWIVPVEGGSSRPVPGTEPNELPAGWTADGRSLYVYRPGSGAPTRVYLLDVAGGQRKLWKEITPADAAGTYGIEGLVVNPDGKSYVYTLRRILSDLYLVEGLK